MQALSHAPSRERYARCIDASKRIRWDIDRDVIRGREFDFSRNFLPDNLACMERFAFLGAGEQRFLSQVQGRTYCNMFGLVERFIGAKVIEVGRDHALGDQVALEALVRFTDEELKHQELFRRLETMIASGMPAGYVFLPQPNDVASAVLGKSTWAVLGLICHIELFSQSHYRQSIEGDANAGALWKDVFLFHWKEESQHAILDEMEWRREDDRLSPAQRDAAVDELIALVGAVDGILQIQAAADTDYFVRTSERPFDGAQVAAIGRGMLAAYRWQYIGSGVSSGRFAAILASLASEARMGRVQAALAPLLAEPATA